MMKPNTIASDAGNLLAKPDFIGWTEPASISVGSGAWRFVWLALTMITGLSLVIGAACFAFRQQGPTSYQLGLKRQVCADQIEPGESLRGSISGVPSRREVVPGLGRFLATYELYPDPVITLADLVVATGHIQYACLDSDMHHGRPVVWARLALMDGQIEAYVLLPSNLGHFSPDMPVHMLYYYAPGESYPVHRMEPWRGFTSVVSYRNCGATGTATPP